jgi:hypothetical protein
MPVTSSGGPQLEERIRALELQIDDLRSARRRRRITTPRPMRRMLTVLTVIAAVGILPMVVLASDTFSDVPDSNTFHDSINHLYAARIATGCATSPTLQYCPGAAVTRGQMAAFLNRGLGRAANAQGTTTVTADATSDVATVTIEAGGTSGGTGFVVVTGSLSAYTLSGTTCPCEVSIRVRDTTSGTEPSLWQFFDVSNTATPTGYRNASGTISWAFTVPSGADRTFVARAGVNMTGATGSLTLQAHLTAVYVPFGSTGGSTLSTLGEGGVTNGRAGD